ncbi:MAG TPA: hypothetical protein VJK03_00705 [Candidatus Nanoarchaeia archaeon]|nr:hypothetical protein [Candidatus Nanoarchaeia archaeon]
MSRIIGLFEGLGAFGFGIAGTYIGYQLGSEAIEYARTITEKKDVLAYLISQHPTMTKLTTTVGFCGIMFEVGKICGLVDLVFKTYDSPDERLKRIAKKLDVE